MVEASTTATSKGGGSSIREETKTSDSILGDGDLMRA